MFIETSAKAGFNVKALFKKIAQVLPGNDAPTGTTEGQSIYILIIRIGP
jgi:Ras-related protein Rab-6A